MHRQGRVRHRAEQRGGVGVVRLGQQLFGPTALDDPTAVHHIQLLAGPADHSQVVGDQHQPDAPGLPQVGQHPEHLRLDRDVQRRGRLVRQDQRRLGGQRDRDADPLPHPAGHLVRVGPVALLRVADPHLGQQVQRAGPGCGFGHPQPAGRHLGHLVTDPHRGVQRGERVLEDHRQRAGQVLAAPGRRQPGDVHPGDHDGAAGDPGRRGQQVHDRPQGQALAGAGLPHQADRLAGRRRERHLPDGVQDPARQRDLHLEVTNLQQGGHRRSLRCTKPSAISASDSPVITTARPGTAARYHLVKMKACPSWIIEPQSGVGWGTPSPR